MTIYAITDTKKGETGIAPTYLQTPEIIYSIVYDVNNKQQLRHPFIRLRREGSNETAKFGRLVARFPRAAVTELWCQLIADDLVRPTDHATYASPTIGC